jgi:hypothetical protein
MRTLVMASIAGAGLLLAACEPTIEVKTDGDATLAAVGGGGDLKTISRLECPERENKLRRTAAAADGRACTYAGADGEEIRLQLVTLDGRATTEVLQPFRAEADNLLPFATPLPPEPPAVEPALDQSGAAPEGERVRVRLPGVSIDADDSGARVSAGGVSIDADEKDGRVHVRDDQGRMSVHADDATGRTVVDVNAGEDGELRSTYLRSAEAPGPSGWRTVAYEARGPQAGPVVVATLRTRARDHDDAVDAMKDLVRKNVGD